MITPKMVPADLLVKRVAEYLKENVSSLKPPYWVYYAKTASYKERVPDNPEEWWYLRAASLLRKLYISSEPIGVETTRTIYSGRKRRGARPPITVKAPGHSARIIFQQLEKAGLVIKTTKGRIISPKGRALLDRISYEIFKGLADQNPDLKKYLE
ncbi:MAG: 30S ribosomal protein S19e [Sulfolobaceae archaeon]